MNQKERRNYLIQYLLHENPEYHGILMPDNTEEQKNLLRALFNVRPPHPVSAEFLTIQDEYLTAEVKERGVVDSRQFSPVGADPRIFLWQGDITRLKIDAIVNAANSALLGCFQPCHSCIDNIIHTLSGVQLRLKCNEIMRQQESPPHMRSAENEESSPHIRSAENEESPPHIRSTENEESPPHIRSAESGEATGTAKITPGYNLPCRFVLHTVGPIISGPLQEKDMELLADCYRSCLDLAVQYDLKSIAFCCISTGVFHFPQDKAAEIALNTVKDFLAHNQSLEQVIFNVFTDKDMEIYQQLLTR